jgi:hypothetical protein
MKDLFVRKSLTFSQMSRLYLTLGAGELLGSFHDPASGKICVYIFLYEAIWDAKSRYDNIIK